MRPPSWSARTVDVSCLLLFGIAALWLLRSFVPAALFAATVAVLVWPLYQRLLRQPAWRQRPTVAAMLICVVFGGLLVVPTAYAGVVLLQELALGWQAIKTWQTQGIPAPTLLRQAPAPGPWLHQLWQQELADPNRLQEWGRYLLAPERLWGGAQQAGQVLLHGVGQLLLAVVFLFLLLRDGRRGLRQLRRHQAHPLGHALWRYGRLAVAAVRASLAGTVLASVVEGLLLAVGFWWLGLPWAGTLGLFIGVLAAIPLAATLAVGATAALAWLHAGPALGSGTLLWGLLVVLVLDSYLRPALLSRGVRLSFGWGLLGLLGGLASVGILGLVVGPVVLALFQAAVHAVFGAGRSVDKPA